MSNAVEVRIAKELCLKEQSTQKLQPVHANGKSGEVSWANISGDPQQNCITAFSENN